MCIFLWLVDEYRHGMSRNVKIVPRPFVFWRFDTGVRPKRPDGSNHKILPTRTSAPLLQNDTHEDKIKIKIDFLFFQRSHAVTILNSYPLTQRELMRREKPTEKTGNGGERY